MIKKKELEKLQGIPFDEVMRKVLSVPALPKGKKPALTAKKKGRKLPPAMK